MIKLHRGLIPYFKHNSTASSTCCNVTPFFIFRSISGLPLSTPNCIAMHPPADIALINSSSTDGALASRVKSILTLRSFIKVSIFIVLSLLTVNVLSTKYTCLKPYLVIKNSISLTTFSGLLEKTEPHAPAAQNMHLSEQPLAELIVAGFLYFAIFMRSLSGNGNLSRSRNLRIFGGLWTTFPSLSL